MALVRGNGLNVAQQLLTKARHFQSTKGGMNIFLLRFDAEFLGCGNGRHDAAQVLGDGRLHGRILAHVLKLDKPGSNNLGKCPRPLGITNLRQRTTGQLEWGSGMRFSDWCLPT